MSEFNDMPRELDWDDEIQHDGSPFKVLPEGDYLFFVTKFERARHSGSEKIPACNKAVLTLSLKGPEGSGTVQANLFLHSKFEWKLCQFFTAIGQRKHGETMRMNWGAVSGATGYCHVGIRKWTGSDGKEHEGNEIMEFYDPEKAPAMPSAQPAAAPEQTFMDLPQGTPTPWHNGNF